MTAAERHMHMSLDAYVGIAQVVEEMVELAGYMFLLTAQQRVWAGLGKPQTGSLAFNVGSQ